MHKPNSQILKNYLNTKITLYKLASALVEDWELVDKTKYSGIYDLLLNNSSRYSKQIHCFIDVDDIDMYWFILYPLLRELSSKDLSDRDTKIFNNIANAL